MASSAQCVHVLQDQHGGAAAVLELGEQGREDGVAVAPEQCRREPAPSVPHRVAQRAEGARRDEVVARAEQHPHVVVRPRERSDEAGLAYPGLTRDQHHRTGPARGPVQRRLEAVELGVTFEKARIGLQCGGHDTPRRVRTGAGRSGRS
ncbi:MAG TPA: hypothetical protein VLK57_07825 [Pseudonocardia sp.]|nr:hypothetical protein [Pseudonocardia sp.]